MNGVILLLIWLLPLLLAALAGRRHARWVIVLAPFPALFAAAALPIGSSLSLPWLLLGVELGLDTTGRTFLLFSGLLWFLASLYAAGDLENGRNTSRFRRFFLLAMAGNLGLIVARDMVSFYLGFTLMGLATYGLIAHAASQRARRAAGRYLVWTIAGELMLFSALVLLAAQNGGALAFTALAENPPAGIALLLLVAGFGIKLALPGLHLWLPQAYAVAPPAAVAVLSGAMINAGLLGWLRFIPPGDAALASWGQALIGIGLVGILFGSLVALLQRQPRLVLGYSSISKMGVLTTGMGAALAWPAAAPAVIGAVVIYAAHHALVKGALFLGLGLLERAGSRLWLLAGLGFLALALAGAPLTSGALAKSAFTTSLPQPAHPLVWVLTVSAFATTLVMARFLFLIVQRRAGHASPCPVASILAWLLLLAGTAAFPFLFADQGDFMTGIVPVSLAALLAALVLRAGIRIPARIVMGKRRLGVTRFATRLGQRIESQTRRACQAGRARISVLRCLCESGRSDLVRVVKSLRTSDADEHLWPLAGGVWLGIAVLLVSTFFAGG